MKLTERYISSGKVNTASLLVKTFKQRVLADGGTFEAENFLTQWTKENLDLYNRSSFLITPNGYKAGTLYAFKGQDWNNFLRAGSGTRINESFTEELMATNIPRIDYEHGAPAILREIQTTNLINNSASPATQSITVTSGQSYTLSFFGTGTVTVSNAFTETVNGTSATIKTWTNFAGVTAGSTTVTLTISGSVTNCNFVLRGTSYNQPTSHIPRVASSVTRVVDNFQALTLGTSYFNTPYLCFMEFIDVDNVGNSFAGGQYQVLVDSNNAIFQRVDGILMTRIAGALLVTVSGGSGGVYRSYGNRIRLLTYVNPSTGQMYRSTSYNNGTGWYVVSAHSNNGNTFSLPTSLDKVQIGNVTNYGGATTKIKQFAIIKDFTGISNIHAYMQGLAAKTSI